MSGKPGAGAGAGAGVSAGAGAGVSAGAGADVSAGAGAKTPPPSGGRSGEKDAQSPPTPTLPPQAGRGSADGVDGGAPDGAGAGEGEEDVVPRIRRGGGFRINPTDLFRIAAVALLLVGIIMLQRPCADGVATFVTSVGGIDAGPEIGDGGPDLGELRMLTDDEIRAAFDGDGAEKLLERGAHAGDAGPDALADVPE